MVGVVVWGDCSVKTEGSLRTGFVRALRNDNACAVVAAREWATGRIYLKFESITGHKRWHEFFVLLFETKPPTALKLGRDFV